MDGRAGTVDAWVRGQIRRGLRLQTFWALLVGASAGAHASTWGMYKDAPHEGFVWAKYFRSIVLAAGLSVAIHWWTELDPVRPSGIVVLWGLVYAIERLLTELWKGYLREEDQSKYFIPMRFAVGGKPVKDWRIRWIVLAGVLAALGLFVWGVLELQRTFPNLPPWLVLVTVGSLGGWLTAFGGAWKDAPVEGFETLKFFRSPVISFLWAVVIAHFTDNWLYISVAATGYSVATIETYKKFFFSSKPPGKFEGKRITHPDILEWRHRFVPLYAAIWIGIVVSYAMAFTQPRDGLI